MNQNKGSASVIPHRNDISQAGFGGTCICAHLTGLSGTRSPSPANWIFIPKSYFFRTVLLELSYWIVTFRAFEAGAPGFVATSEPLPALARSLAGIATVT